MLRLAWWKALCGQWAETRGYSLNRCQWAGTRDYSVNHCQNLDSEVTNATSTKAVSTPELNLPTTHHSSWKPKVLPPATLTSRTGAPHQAYFLTWLVSELNSIMSLSGLGPRPWPSCKRSWGEKFSDFYLAGGHENSVQRGLTTEDLTGVVSYALMLVAVCVFSYFGLWYIPSHQKRQKSTHPSLSKQVLTKIQESALKSRWCQYSLPSLELKVCMQQFRPRFHLGLPGLSSASP